MWQQHVLLLFVIMIESCWIHPPCSPSTSAHNSLLLFTMLSDIKRFIFVNIKIRSRDISTFVQRQNVWRSNSESWRNCSRFQDFEGIMWHESMIEFRLSSREELSTRKPIRVQLQSHPRPAWFRHSTGGCHRNLESLNYATSPPHRQNETANA